MAHKTVAVPPKIVMAFAIFAADNSVRIVKKTYNSSHGGGEGSPSAVAGYCAGSTASGIGLEVRAVGGGTEKSAGAAVGDGGFGVAEISIDGPCSKGDNGGGIRDIGSVLGGGWGDRAGGGGEPCRGERRISPSPSTAWPRNVSSPPFSSALQAVERE